MNSLRNASYLLSLWLVMSACEAGGDSILDTRPPDDDVGAAGGGGDGGAASGAGGGFTTSAGTGGMETCAGTEAEAQPKKLHMLVVLDRSGSMGSGASSKWGKSVAALTDYINDPASAGTSVGINYFPPLESAADQCAEESYNPPMVPMGDLPGHASTLASSMNGTSTTGVTPTYGALFGSLRYATELQDQAPDDVVVVVLGSDGTPTTCDTNIANIASLAASAYGYNGVRTFAVAIAGSDLADLGTIATAGGGEAFDVTGNSDLFKEKLDAIRANALGCEYDIPEPDEGEEIDPLKVNVTYTPGGGGAGQELPQADDAADCGQLPGWYYDDPLEPTKIILCPASCNVVQGDTEANVSLVFGCPTVVN